MERMTLRIAIACLTFAIGIGATAIYLISRKTSVLPPTSARIIYDVSYPELATNHANYVGKMVRVNALMEGSGLDDPRLIIEKVPHNILYYEFAPEAKGASAKWSATFKPNAQDVPSLSHEMSECGRALVTITGEFLGGKIRIHDFEMKENCPRLWFHEALRRRLTRE